MVRMVYAGSAYERRGGRFVTGVACAGGMDKHRRLLLPLPLGGYRPTLRGLILHVRVRMAVKIGIPYRNGSKGVKGEKGQGGKGQNERAFPYFLLPHFPIDP